MKKLIIILSLLFFSTNLFADWDLLIHTSDTSPYNTPKNTWTNAMEDDDRASNMKQGYVQRVEKVPYNWGRLEKDPKRFLHIIIPDNQFNPAWLDKLVDIDGEDIQDAIWKFDIKKILTVAEYNALINIPFNDTTVRPVLSKTIAAPANMIELVDWQKEKNRVPLKLHGSAGEFDIQEDGGGDYTSLKTAVETEAADISGGSTDANFTINEAWASADTGNWDIDGWTMGSNNMLILTAGASRHSGTSYSATVHRIENATQAFDIEENNVTIDGIELTATVLGIETSLAVATNTVIKNVLANGGGGTAISTPIQIGTGTATILNCSIYKTRGAETGSEGIRVLSTAGAVGMYNCTVNGFDDGIEMDSNTGNEVKNCAIFNNGNDIDDTSSATIDFNATDDGDGTNSVDISPGGTEADDWNAAVTDYVNGDHSVKDASSVIENAGTDLSGSGVTDDIIATARPQDSVYDIGAFEFVVADGAPAFIPKIQMF